MIDDKRIKQKKNIDYDYFEIYEPIGNKQIEIRGALKKRKPFDVPLKQNTED